MTFVVIGGGPTGVELAGSIAELAFKTLVREFRHIDTRRARVVLLEGGPRLLPSFSAATSDYARKALERLGIEVRLDSPATACGPQGVTVGDEMLEAATLIWAAGVQASGAARWLGADSDRAGRVIVAANLAVPTLKNVFVIGDTAAASDGEGRQLPGIAPVAKQQGRYVATLIAARVAGRRDPPPFRYRDAGQLATIGRRAGVIDYRRLRLTGWIAWWVWGVAHIYFLINMRSRLSVALEWLWSYFTYQRGARLIVDDS
jgi:NADH dehydrogenase